MQTQNLHNQNAQATADLAKKGSKENPYDRLMSQGDDSVAAKFSNVLSTLKTRMSGGVLSNTEQKNVSMVKDISASQKDSMDAASKDFQKRLDDEEEEKKSRNRKLADDRERMMSLNAEAAEIASMTRMDIAAEAQTKQSQNNADMLEEKAEQTKTMRPSDILASAFSRSGSASASTSSSSVSNSVAASVGGSSVASTSVGGAVSGTQGAASTTTSTAQGESAGMGSQNSGSSFASSSSAVGYGTDEMTESAQAAQKMMDIEGVETDEKISQTLQDRSRRQESEIRNAQNVEADNKAREINKLNNQELRQNLDVLARETNVSKLSLQMSNPQTMAQERRDAQALNGLPTSRDNTNSLTASAQSSNNLLNSLNGVADDAAAAGMTLSGASSASAAAKADAKPTAQQNVLAQNRVNAVGEESDSQTLIKNANKARLSHGAEAEGSRAALANKGVRSTADAQQSQNAANAAGTAKNSQTVNQRTQANLSELARHSSSDASKVLNGGDEVLKNVKDVTTSNESGKTNNAQEALLRLATAQQNDKSAAAKLMAEAQARNSLLSDEALKSDATRSESVNQALNSLKSGIKGLSSTAQSTTYSQSSLFASMFGDGEGVAALSDSDGASTEFGSSDSSEQDAAFAGMASSQQAQATDGAKEAVPAHMTRFAFTGSEDTDASEIHERVMQMAARNMKQLSMELSPNEMGKMKISIELSDTNDAVSVSLAAANPQTRAILEKALPKLKEILSQQNIKTDASVSDLDESEVEVANVVANNRPSAAAVTKAASSQRHSVNVATDDVSVDALIANARSLSDDDKAAIQGIVDDNSSMDLSSANRELSSFAKRGTVVARG
ncbi:MAG: flagellar hook-length control protein FliK [Anaerobiospirillum succiniciproducens]|uniref:flagellar hook-length control protein FliK n=1 Tax=Anaerobiospirillum succiniciproducens TaxID=13335 RepID=UPI0026DA859B|nr:flagellar hook-length control protein FliK [Anaerobiospirillum succiniciproducens]MDO4675266.1 flagellar hook-length control protein FliK [Anaerobiospirillum succiniciproducens]